MKSSEFTGWHKATRSTGGNGCVEIGYKEKTRGIRDTTLGQASPIIEISSETFAVLIQEIRNGRLRR